MYQKVILIGNLGSDPEVRYTTNSTAVANVSLATSKKWKDKDGEQQERTEWHSLVFWGKKAEVAGEYLHKGSKVFIEGELQTRDWEDKEGVKRYKTEVVVNEFKFLDAKKSGSNYDGYEPPVKGSPEDDDIPF